MTQEQLKQEFLNYAEYNLDNETILKAINELLSNISNELYENGYSPAANSLTAAELMVAEVLESSNI